MRMPGFSAQAALGGSQGFGRERFSLAPDTVYPAMTFLECIELCATALDPAECAAMCAILSGVTLGYDYVWGPGGLGPGTTGGIPETGVTGGGAGGAAEGGAAGGAAEGGGAAAGGAAEGGAAAAGGAAEGGGAAGTVEVAGGITGGVTAGVLIATAVAALATAWGIGRFYKAGWGSTPPPTGIRGGSACLPYFIDMQPQTAYGWSLIGELGGLSKSSGQLAIEKAEADAAAQCNAMASKCSGGCNTGKCKPDWYPVSDIADSWSWFGRSCDFQFKCRCICRD
jgi:hypothetical protein